MPLSNAPGGMYTDCMKSTVAKFIQTHGLIAPKGKVLVGLSGGPDSVALLHVLLALGYDVCAVHVNHEIRGADADEDEAFVRVLCESLRIPLTVERLDVPAMAEVEGKTLEQAARDARYDCFARLAAVFGASVIAVAHHRDDQAESILLHLFRGSGLTGLVGMRPRRGNVVRPLLCVKRADIETYLSENGLSYCTDTTNFLRCATRNRIRLDVIPYLRENLNPAIVDSLCSTAELLRRDEDYLDSLARSALAEACTQVGYDRRKLAAQPLPVLTRALRIALCAAGATADVDRCHIERLCSMLAAQTGTRADLPHIAAWISNENICFGTIPDSPEFCVPFCLSGITKTPLGDFFAKPFVGEIEKSPAVGYMDAGKLPDGLCVRTRRDGDRFFPLGAPGRKKLKDFFIDRKVPREGRALPMLYAQEEALFLPGYGISETVKVDSSTRDILRVTYHPIFNGGTND